MKVEQRSPSDPASRLRMTIIETSRKRQLEKLLLRSTNIPQRQPLPVTRDKLKPNIENITGEKAKALISGYSPEALHRWQQSIVNQSSLKTIVTIADDTYLYYKLCQRFFNRNNRMPELKDLIEMNDQTLEEVMGGGKKKEETITIRQSMIQHNVLPSDSQIVFQIDLLGLPERAREILVSHNIKTIESICQIIGKELESDEKTMSISRFIKNQLLKFIQELAEWEKRSSPPEGLPTSLKQSKPPILEKKQRQIIEKPKRPKGKKQAVLKQYGLKDDNGNITESWPALLVRLCEDVPLQELANLLNIAPSTLSRWRKEAGLPRRSIVKTKRINLKELLSPEEKLERKRQKIINKLSAVNETRDDPIGYINQKLKDGVTARDLFNDLREKGLEIKTTFIFYRWLKVLGIPIQSNLQAKAAIYQKVDIYQEAKRASGLTQLTSNQRIILEMVFDQGLIISEAARRLSVEKNKTVSYQYVRQYIIGALKRLEKLKSSPEKKELTGLAYLQVMFPGRLGTITYNTLKKKKNINTLEELKNSFSNLDTFAGIGSKGMQACVDLLSHFFPDDEFVNPLLVKKPRIIQEKPRKTIEKPKKIAKKGSIYQEGADIYQEAKQSGQLTRLVENQQVTLELVYGQGLTLSEAASRLSVKKNKNILPTAIRMYIVGALDRLKKLKSSPTDLAYLQAMFPNRFGTIIYDTLRKKNINTPEELKSFLAKGDDLTGIGIKGIQMCVEVLKHFFPDEELELIKLAYKIILSMSFGKQAGH